jgi:DNA (cytosine-5)-methyltransferase 1
VIRSPSTTGGLGVDVSLTPYDLERIRPVILPSDPEPPTTRKTRASGLVSRPSASRFDLKPSDSLSELRCADLFAGAGGLTTGLHAAGFRSAFFNEIDQQAAATYALNYPAAVGFIGPIEDLSVTDIAKQVNVDDLDLVVGGPPCQGFSINAPVRSVADKRNHLFQDYVRLVLEGLKPKFIIFENVPGLVSFNSGQSLRDVTQAFERAGYRVVFRILNACHYGVPEERWRLLILGTRLPGVELTFPEPTHYSVRRPNFSGGLMHTFRDAIRPPRDSLFPLLSPTTVAEAIDDLPRAPSDALDVPAAYRTRPSNPYQRSMRSGSKRVTDHVCHGLSDVNLERIRHVPPGGSWRDVPFELLPAGMKRARRSDHTRRYGRLLPTDVSGTILTKCDPHWGTVVHYAADRILTVREAARIQSFPDTFKFLGSASDMYRQVGNAVPPLLAKAMGMHVRKLLVRGRQARR